MSKFSAAAPALGYFNQVRIGLLKILENEDAQLRMEALDDIDLSSATGPIKLFQLKHRADGTQLTDYSEDLWKTLRVWATHVADTQPQDPPMVYTLVTTATAVADSVASLLRSDDKRDETKAASHLLAVIGASKNKALASAMAAYTGLTTQQQALLLSRIIVADQAPTITDARAILEDKLKFSVAPKHRSAFVDRIEGWWFAACVQHLVGKRPYLSAMEVHVQLIDLAQGFQEGALPIDCYATAPTALESQGLNQRTFVQQLRSIKVRQQRIQTAVLDYYRAFEQRSRWVRDNLIVDVDLEQYEDRLLDEWNRIRLELEEELDEPASDDALIQLGRELLKWAEQTAAFHIRPKVTEPYVMRGSFHILADGNPPRLWWHRNFVAQLKAAITSNAA